jgi:hypothetical protein
VFQASVDRFGWPVAGAGSVEVGEHLTTHLLFASIES